MLRRIPWIASVAVLFVAILSACGSKNPDSVVKDLSKVADKLDSYQGSGRMTLYTGQQPLTYNVEVWYQKPNYYRIALTSQDRDITQIVLRNDQGVYVLTPQLKKSYRFQSDWPDNQGQVYLYQTLLSSISVDNSRKFTTDKDAYVFDVMASNYNNGSFARQKIWLAKNDYSPRKVQVTDTNANLMVEVNFTNFEFGKKFDKSSFDMQQNMAGAPGSDSSGSNNPDNRGQSESGGDQGKGGNPSPSPQASGKTDGSAAGGADGTTPDGSAQSGADGQASGGDDGAAAGGTEGATDGSKGGTDATSGSADGEDQGATPAAAFVEIEPDPDALPAGVTLRDRQDIQLGDIPGTMLRYSGTYDFTLVETMPKDEAVSGAGGHMLDMGFTVGMLSGEETQTLTWTYDGIEYRLTTVNLPQEDMIRIAQSTVTSSGK